MWMFLPFTIHIGIFFYKLIKSALTSGCRYAFSEASFGQVLLHLPFVQTVRNVYNAWKLYKLGFGFKVLNPRKSAEVEAILREVGLSGQYESFFESGPQAITQCVIVLSTGRISTIQMISITISVISLTWGAGRSFFIQRQVHLADPDPPAVMVLARVFFYKLTVTVNCLLLWTFIGGLLGRFTVVALLLNFVTVYVSVKLLPGTSEQDSYFCLKSSICAVWVPSVCGDKEKMYIVSAVVSLLCKVVLLCLAVGVAFSGG